MMADSPVQALVKRASNDVSLMPPPPFKRIKRPSTVLDEDEYTAALSEIIARDYFPGLLESQAQHEYLAALESGSKAWIAEAGQQLREAAVPQSSKRRTARNTRFDRTPTATPQHNPQYGVADTPVGFMGGETPLMSRRPVVQEATKQQEKAIETSTLSLNAFQAKYTSEDNESFNTVLDKQNLKRREHHAHLWTQEQRIPSARQIAHRVREAKLIEQKKDDEAAGKALIPITSGATDSRPAKPDSWKIEKPDNTFMFHASSIDEDGMQTVQEVKERSSKAGPKHVVHANTRLPPTSYMEDQGPVPPSPSLNTEVIARRDAHRAGKHGLSQHTEVEYTGNETPRVNGYAFIEEDEPENISVVENVASYRDLLAGQVGDATPNPFKIGEIRKREDLHWRMVEKQSKKKREKDRETSRSGPGIATPFGSKTPTLATVAAGNMTPAAKRLMEKLGSKTPAAGTAGVEQGSEWTPLRTPRKRNAAR